MSPYYIENILFLQESRRLNFMRVNYIFIRIIDFKAVVIKNLAFDIFDKYQMPQIKATAIECIFSPKNKGKIR